MDEMNSNNTDDQIGSDDSGWDAVKFYHEKKDPKVIEWTIKLSGGLVKNKRQASYVLFGFVVVAIIVSSFLFLGGGRDIKLSPEEERLINNINFSDKSSRTHQIDEQIFNQ
jgi:hypothetical protein